MRRRLESHQVNFPDEFSGKFDGRGLGTWRALNVFKGHWKLVRSRNLVDDVSIQGESKVNPSS